MNENTCEQTDAGDEGAIREKLTRIGHTFVVLSGKGGVGKSTVAVNLALSLIRAEFQDRHTRHGYPRPERPEAPGPVPIRSWQ